MPDTFLESHRIDSLQYMISAPLTPISIRDQMVRAKMFVDRAIEAGLIGLDRPLLIVGAGAGGVTAALCAAGREIKVTLIEIAGHPFNFQRKCLSRWINPTQYDWPAHHWDEGIFPWTHPPMPLPWRSWPSNLIAASWIQELRKGIREYADLLTVKFNTTVSPIVPPKQGLLEVNYQEDLRSKGVRNFTEYFGAALYAKGPGSENTEIGTYKSFSFWETDDFEKSNLGLPMPIPPSRYKVLICGGGDGALQDFLRITTGQHSVTDIMFRIWRFMPRDLVLWLFSEEDQAHRASLWNTKPQNHPVLQRLHDVHRRFVQRLLQPPSGPAIIAELQVLLQHSQTLDVTFIHPCTHFSSSYSLNRLLVHLIATYAQMEGLPISIRAQKNVIGVAGTNHTCAKTPSYCHGQEHRVDCGDAPTCDSVQANNAGLLGHFHAVILRLGVTPPPPFSTMTKPLFTRHSIPYHAPF